MKKKTQVHKNIQNLNEESIKASLQSHSLQASQTSPLPRRAQWSWEQLQSLTQRLSSSLRPEEQSVVVVTRWGLSTAVYTAVANPEDIRPTERCWPVDWVLIQALPDQSWGESEGGSFRKWLGLQCWFQTGRLSCGELPLSALQALINSGVLGHIHTLIHTVNIHICVYTNLYTQFSSDRSLAHALPHGSFLPQISTPWLYLPVKQERHHSHLTHWGPEVWTETRLTQAQPCKTIAVQPEIGLKSFTQVFSSSHFIKGSLQRNSNSLKFRGSKIHTTWRPNTIQ